MAGEADCRRRGVAGREGDLLQGGEAGRALGSSPCGHEDEDKPRVSSRRSRSSSVGSSSSSSLGFEGESAEEDDDMMYPPPQSECEEIPSLRWMASPPRWWKTRKRTHPSRRRSTGEATSRDEPPGLTMCTEVKTDEETPTELVHFDGHRAFELEHLLRAPSGVLGGGAYGTVYKSTLKNGNQVAVWRLKWVETTKDFLAEVNMLGKIRHPNLMAPRAYYCSSDEKLLVFDYMPNGSLSSFIHARCNENPIDWPTRIDILIQISRGLHYLHTKENIIHGNLTSVNILLDDQIHAKIARYGLFKPSTTATNTNVMKTSGASRYDAPELSGLKKANIKTDVYSLGVIMFDLLSGKVSRSNHFPKLRPWIGYALKLALNCMNPLPNARPGVEQVLQQLDGMKKVLARATSGGNNQTMVDPPSDFDGTAATDEAWLEVPTRPPLNSKHCYKTRNRPWWARIMASVAPATDSSTPRSEDKTSESTSTNGNVVATPGRTMASQRSSFDWTKVAVDEGCNEGPNSVPLVCRDCSKTSRNLPQRVGTTAVAAPTTDSSTPRSEDKTSESTSANGNDTTVGVTMLSPLSSIDWAKAAIDEVRLEVPTTPPLIRSDPDLIYQRYFQTLYDLAYRSRPLPSNVLEVQLNTICMELHNLGYPLDTWLKTGTLVLACAKKREFIKHYVDDYKVRLEAQLEELNLASAPVEEELSRTQSDMTTLERKQEELNETIAKLEDQLAGLKAQRVEVVDLLSAARDQLAVVKAKRDPLLVDIDHLNQQYAAISVLQSTMLDELPPMDEVFDSNFKEIMARKF